MTQPTFTPPEPNAALVVGPDDQLVMVLPKGTSPEELKYFREALEPHFGDRAVVVCGVEELAVLRKYRPLRPVDESEDHW